MVGPEVTLMTTQAEVLLLVDDDPHVLESTASILTQEFELLCERASTGSEALRLAQRHSPVTVLLDLGLPDLNGEDVLRRIKAEFPEVPVIIITALADLETAVRCMGLGAYDYIVKGADPRRLVASVRRSIDARRRAKEIEALRERMQSTTLHNPAAFSQIITDSEAVRSIFRFIEAVSTSDEPILIQGETGTGKELFAQAVHRASGTKGPFVATNLGGLDDHMVSDTLFGHIKGAFTGVNETRKGMISSAAGGTLFLDEIGELSQTSQVKLLRFLESREYHPLGSDVARKSDARIVAATNRNLASLVEEGRFRKDLLYRLSTYRVDIPPLRDRLEDLGILCAHLLGNKGAEAGVLVSEEALGVLQCYSFPGNIRELRGLLMRARVMSPPGCIDPAALRSLVGQLPPSPPGSPPADPPPSPPFPTIQQAIANLVAQALRASKGQQNLAAKLLGISPQALSKRLHKDSTP